jgi:hypothetical protein
MGSHDRKLDEHILEILEDERDAMKTGNIKLAQDKFNQALGVMRAIKAADFEMAPVAVKKQASQPSESGNSAESKVSKLVSKKVSSKLPTKLSHGNVPSKAKPISDWAPPETASKNEYRVSDLEQEHTAVQFDAISEGDSFAVLKSNVKSLLQKVKGDEKTKAQAEQLLREHHGLLESLKSMKAGKQQPTTEIFHDMEALHSSLLTMTTSKVSANLEKQPIEDIRDVGEFKQLKAELRTTLNNVKANTVLRSQAESVLKKFHPLLAKIKGMKNSRTAVSRELVSQMRALKTEIASSLAATSTTLEKQTPKKAPYHQIALNRVSKELERVKKAQADLEM